MNQKYLLKTIHDYLLKIELINNKYCVTGLLSGDKKEFFKTITDYTNNEIDPINFKIIKPWEVGSIYIDKIIKLPKILELFINE